MSNIVAGIDVGTHTIRVMLCDTAVSGRHPKIIAHAAVPSLGVRHGHILNAYETSKSIQKALVQAEKMTGERIKSAYVSAGGVTLQSHVTQKIITFPEGLTEITPTLIENAITRAEEELLARIPNIKIIDYAVQDYTLDTQTLHTPPIGMKTRRLVVRVLFISMLEHHYQDLIEVVTNAGVHIEDVVPAPLATASATLSSKHKIAGVLLADIGAETVSLAVYDDNVLRMLRVLKIGSSDITNDIALGFKIPIEEAEEVKTKRREPTQKQDALGDVISARVEEIFELIRKQLKGLNRDGLLPAGIVITGGGSRLESIDEFAKDTLSLPSRVAHMPVKAPGQKRLDASWLAVYGVCHSPMIARYSSKKSISIGNMFDGIGDFFKNFLP